MKRRSSGSSQDGADSSQSESDAVILRHDTLNPTRESRSSPSIHKSKRPSRLNWEPSNDGRPLASIQRNADVKLSQRALAASPPNMTRASQPTGLGGMRRKGLWSLSILALFTSLLGILLLFAIVKSFVTHEIDPKGCRMSYMRPSYVHFSDFDTEHTRFATKYSLYIYREQGIDDDQKVNTPSPHSYIGKPLVERGNTNVNSFAVRLCSSSLVTQEATSRFGQ